MGTDRRIKAVRAGWTDLVLVCRKCSRKLDGGFGPDGDQRLAKALRRALEAPRAEGGRTKGAKVSKGAKRAKGRRARVAVVEAGCFDLCPKGAVVALRAAEPGRWLVVPAGTAMDEVIAGLGLSPGPAEAGPDFP